ncbi:MAG: hypothetical protein Q9191_001341 [Dirinaria sp. TL-2023a]
MPVTPPARCPQYLQSRFSFHLAHSPTRWHSTFARDSSNDASLTKKRFAVFPDRSELRAAEPLALARLPTASVFRSLLLGAFFSSSLLFTPGFAFLKKISNSPSRMLNPDKNPILRAIVKPLVYDQFCAGRNRSEIQEKISQIKSLGFSGVILCYGKEIQIQKYYQPEVDWLSESHQGFDQGLDLWKQGNLETLDMIGDGDYLGIKYTGAGKSITDDLLRGNAPPRAFVDAMDAILQRAMAQNCRIWIDAEQQVLQHSIDRWTIDLMRKYNRSGKVVLYNTLQAYLKSSRKKLEQQLQLAHEEGWTLAIKLVRGAYIENDVRERIHDTKAQTDECYNSIVQDLLSGNVKGIAEQDFPKMQLFLAGHNPISISKASDLVRELQLQGKLKTLPEFGQLQGMADQLGCELLQHGEDTARVFASKGLPVAIPRVYKCLTWGSIQECMQYLVRRAVENRGGTGAIKDGMPALARELRRRTIDALMGRRRTLG